MSTQLWNKTSYWYHTWRKSIPSPFTCWKIIALIMLFFVQVLRKVYHKSKYKSLFIEPHLQILFYSSATNTSKSSCSAINFRSSLPLRLTYYPCNTYDHTKRTIRQNENQCLRNKMGKWRSDRFQNTCKAFATKLKYWLEQVLQWIVPSLHYPLCTTSH